MLTIGTIRQYCKENKIKFTVTKHKTHNFINKITITKPRAIKITLNRSQVSHSFWDNNRRTYSSTISNHWSYCNLDDDADIAGWHSTIMELLETEECKEKAPKTFPVPKAEFSPDIVTRYTNGLVKANITLTQAFVSGVVKVTSRGIIKEMQPNDKCDCWFLIDGRSKCPTSCDGKPFRFIYDGEKYYATVEKTDKSCRVADNQITLSNIDKVVVEAAMNLYLNFKEKRDE